MEIIILLIIGIGIYFYISNNSRKVTDETVITTTQTVKTEYGEQTITRTTTINDVQTDVRNPKAAMNYPDHKIIRPQVNVQPVQQPVQITEESTLKQIEHSTTIPSPQLKKCTNCERIQPTTEFRANHNQPDGLTKWCISCLDKNEKIINPASLQGMKFCPKCKQNRRKSSFYPTKKYDDGLSKWCKFCLGKH